MIRKPTTARRAAAGLAAAVVAVLVLGMPGAAAYAACGATATDSVSSVAQQISQASGCWSCQLYESVYTGMHRIVEATYVRLVSGSLGAVALGATIVGITLIAKILPFLVGTSSDPRELVAGLRMFIFRVTVVFLVFLGSGAASLVAPDGFLSNFLIDGPLALGTAIGESLSTASAATFAAAVAADPTGLSASGSLFGTSGGGNVAAFTSVGGEHVRAAKAMLLNLHQLGVVGIVTGLWLATQNPNIQFIHPGTSAVIILAGLFMTFSFLMFTITFGLRYIDALIRSMLIFALSPLFIYLWIFDSTRGISVQALKSGLALAGVFAVSGVVFSVAYAILMLGYGNAFSGQGVTFAGLSDLLCSMGNGQAGATIGTAPQGAALNWMAYFYLIGSGAMATACASLAFDLSSQIFDFGPADLGIGKAVQSDVQGGVSKAVGVIRGGV